MYIAIMYLNMGQTPNLQCWCEIYVINDRMFEDCLEYRIFRQTNLMLYLWLVVSVLPSRTGKFNLAQSYQTGMDDIKKYAWSLGSVYIAWGFSMWFLTDAYQSRTVEKMQSSIDWFKGTSTGNHGFPNKYPVFQ